MTIAHHQRPRRGPDAARATARQRAQEGYILVMCAMLLIPLLMMAGLSIDVGSWYSRAAALQKAADAASLAGVVWLPDEVKAASVARDVAKLNGFDDAHPDIVVTAVPSDVSSRRLKVTVQDRRVGSFIYEHVGGHEIALQRTAYAEYVMPVPLGSPRNHFGTGKLLGDPEVAEENVDELLYQSVNPYCTNKVQGDRHQSAHINLSRVALSSCGPIPSAPDAANPTAGSGFRSKGYELYIDAVEGRPAPIEIRLYDARYNSSAVPGPQNGVTCSPTYDGPFRDIPTSPFTLVGPAEYRSSGWSGYGNPVTVPAGSSVRLSGSWYSTMQYRYVTGESCQPTYANEAAIDTMDDASRFEDYTYSVFAADSTPLDDTDNPLICSATFGHDTAFDGYSYLGSVRWNTLCTIPTEAGGGKVGRYILRVTNGRTPGNLAAGTNQWGVVARYANAVGEGLCDGRNSPLCPRVYGKESISVYANSAEKSAAFFLAEIAKEHREKRLKIELFDPGEGGQKLEILRPTGTNSWEPAPFSYQVRRNDGSAWGSPASNVTSLGISGTDELGASKYNAKVVYITVDLSGYDPPPDNNWWKIRYTFGTSVTDRTTWSARVVGDPVHLIEE